MSIDSSVKIALIHDLKKVAHLMNELHALICKVISDLDKVNEAVMETEKKER